MINGKQNGMSDEWYTPKYIFDALGVNFDMDVCAPSPWASKFIYTPTSKFLSEKSLEKDWEGFVWMNPPFGGRNGIIPWLEKLYNHSNGIALTPDRTSAPWWQEYAKKSDAILFISGKVKFIKPDGSTGDQPANGTTLFAYGENAVIALQNANKNNLGILVVNVVLQKLD